MTTRQISDLVRDQRPLVLPVTATVREACTAMRDRGVGAVLVADGDRLAGIFTGRDAVCRILADGRDPARTTLGDAMTRDPATMSLAMTAIDALRLMQDGGFRHVPIVDRGQVVGVISRRDFRGLEQARLDEETGLWERI